VKAPPPVRALGDPPDEITAIATEACAGLGLTALVLAGDAVTVRELLSHTGGAGDPAELYAESVPALADLLGPVISCDGPRGTLRPSNGGVEAVAFLRSRVRDLRTYVVLTSRAITIESVDGRLNRSWLTN